LRRNCLLKHFIEGKKEGRIEVMGKQGTRIQQSQNDLKEKKRLLEIERGNISHSVKSSLWKGIWTCRKTDYLMMMRIRGNVWIIYVKLCQQV
jgi:hypothetical protein